jgi:glyoxylase-like metal-dependent hydrolase (beta-lactamase superfamily II)
LISWSLDKLGFSASRVRSVVLTHSHPDHAGALSSLIAHTDASVGVHADDAGALCRSSPGASDERSRNASTTAP